MAASAWTCPVMLRAWLLGTTALLPAATAALAQGVAPNALPTGGQVVAGQAAISQSGTAMQVRQGSDRAAINWQGFNIGAKASVNFQQPGATSWTLNRVTGPDPSVIAGRMTANGGVAIVNQSGMVFAQGAQVNVGSLIASAANITNENFMAGRMVFDGAPKPGARVENHGSITVADRGLAALVGPRVGNTGTIRARLGRVALAGAETYSLDLAGDGLLSIDVTQAVRSAPGGATALVTNSGVIEANGGAVLITAHAASGLVEDLVRNTGRISANTAAGRTGQVALRAEGGGVRVDGTVTATGGTNERGGRIELRGSSATTLGATARVSTSGGAGGGTVLVGTTGVGRSQTMSARTTVEAGARIRANARNNGNGGTIAVSSTTETVARGSYSVRGGRQGGDGGLVELSGQRALSIAAQVDAAAPKGQRGTLLLDPTSIQVVADADAPADPGAPLGSVTAITTDGVLLVRASDLSTAAATVTLQASQDITISTAVNIAGNTLNLRANGFISQDVGATITAGTLVIRGADGVGAAGSVLLQAANQVGVLDAKASGALSFNNGGANLIVQAATANDVTLVTGGNLTLQGAVSGAAVTLNVSGDISQTATGLVTAGTLTLRDASGNGAAHGVVLDQANAVSTLDAQSAGGLAFANGTTALTVNRATSSADNAAVSLSSGGGMTLAGDVGGAGSGAIGTTGAAVTLAAGGGISQTGGAITARRLGVMASGGGIDLTRGGNQIVGLTATASGSGHGVAVTSSLAMTILASGVTAGRGSTIGLTAPALQIDGAVGFEAADGANRINLAADALAATAVISDGGLGEVSIAPVSASTGVDIGGATAGALRLDPAMLSLVTAGRLNLAATGATALAVNADLTMVTPVLSLAAGGGISQAAGTKIAVSTLIANSSGGAVVLDQANVVGTLDAVAFGAVNFNNGSADLTVTRAVGSAVTLATGGALALQGAVGQAGGTVGLNVDGAISQTAGAVTAATLTIRGAAGGTSRTASASLGQPNAVGTLDARVVNGLLLNNGASMLAVTQAVGSVVTLATTGALELQGVVGQAGAAVTLDVTGAVTQTGGAVTADTLTVRDATGAAPAVSLALGQANAIGAVDAVTTGALSIANGGTDLAVTQAVGGAVTLTTGGALALQGVVSGTAVALYADRAISQSAGAVTASTLRIRGAAGGGSSAASVALGQANAIGTLDARATGSLGITNGSTDLAATQAVGSAVTLVTSGALALQGPVSGTTVALNVDGAISQTAGAMTASTLTVRGAAGGTSRAASASLGRPNLVGTLDARVVNGLLFNNGANTLAVAQAVASAVTLATGGALVLQGAVGQAGGTVVLDADGPISQAADGLITAATLTIRGSDGSGAAGAITLDQANAVGTLDMLSTGDITVKTVGAALMVNQARRTGSGGSVRLASDGDMLLAGAVGGTAAAVHLASGSGGIAQTGGAVTAASLTATAGGGAVAIDRSGNRLNGVTASAGGDGHGVAIRSDGAMSILAGGITAGKGSTIALTGPGITVSHALGFAGMDAANRILLTTDALAATAAIDAGAMGQVRIASITGGIDIGGTTPGALLLSAATLGQVTADRLVLLANGDLRLATTLTLTPMLELIAGGSIAQGAATALSVGRLSATANGGSIGLTGANSIGTVTGSSTDATVGMSAMGDIAVTNTALLANDARILAGAGRTITLRADDLSVGAVIGASIGSLTALNLLPVSAKPVTLGAAAAGAFALDSVEIGRLRPGPAGTLRIGSDGSVTTATTMVVAGNVAPSSAAVLDLQAQRLWQSGGVVTVAAVTGRAVDGFALDRVDGTGAAVNQIDAVGAAGIRVSGGGITLLSARNLTLRGDVVAAGAAGAAGVRLRGLGLAIGEVATPVLVQAGNGDVTLEGGIPGVSVLAGSVVQAGDTSGLHGDILVSGGSVTLGGSLDTLTLAGGRDISVTSTGSMVVEGQTITARRDLILGASGSNQVRSALSAGRDALLSAGTNLGVDAAGSVTAGRDAILAGSASSVLAGNLTAGRSARVTSSSGTVTVGAGVTVTAGADAAADASAELRLTGATTIGNAGSLVSNGRPIFLTTIGPLIGNSGTIDSRGGGGSAGAITLTAATQILNGARGVIRGGVVTLGAQILVMQSGLIDGTDVAVTVGSAGATGVTGFSAASGSSTTASGMLTVTALAGDITAADATLHADGAMVLRADAGRIGFTGGTVSGAATVLLQASGDVAQDGGLVSAGTALQMKAGGDIVQRSGARIVTPVLSGTAGGSVTLLNGIALPNALAARAVGNDIGRIDGFTAGGAFTLASTVPLLRISQLVSAGTGRELRLFADDFALGAWLAAPGGTVSLSPYLRDGSVALVLGGASGASTANTVTLDSAELELLPVGAAARLRLGRVDTLDGGSDFGSVTITGRVDLADPATGLSARVGRLELYARGGITQQAGTRLVVPGLAATAGGDILLDPGDSANRIELLAGIVSEGGSFRLRDGLSGAALGITAGSAVAGDAGAGPDAILVGRSVPAGGKTVTLQVDDLDILAPVRAPGGTIEIAPNNPTRAVTLGGEASTPGGANTLRLTTEELARLGGRQSGEAAQVLRIGRLAGQPAAGTGLISLLGDVVLTGPTAQVQALELVSGGAIRGSSGRIVVPALRAMAAGDIALDNAGNAFLVNAVSGADVTIAQAGDLRLANAVASIGGIDAAGGVTATGTLSLIAGGTIRQDGGALIEAGTLRLQAGGPVTLGERNRFGRLGTVAIGGVGASLIRGFGMTVAGPVATTGSLSLVATDFGNLTVTGSAHADGDLSLATEQGLAEAFGAAPYGRIAVSGILEAGGALTLGTDVGPIALTGAVLQAGGAIALRTGSLNMAGLAGIGISGSTITAGGDIRIDAAGFGAFGHDAPLTVSGSTVTARGGLRLAASRGLQVDTSTIQATGNQSWSSGAGGMLLDHATVKAGGAIALQADRDISIGTSSLIATAGTVSATAGLVTAGAIAIDGSVLNGGAGLALAAKQGIGLTGSTLTAVAGDAALTTVANGISIGSSTLAAQGGAFALAATAGDLALDTSTVTASRALTLTALAGRVSQRRGSLAGATLTVQAGLGISVTDDGGAAPGLTATAGALVLASVAGDIGLTGAVLDAAGDLGVTASAGAIGIGRTSLAAGGAVTLLAATGLGLTDATVQAGANILARTSAGDGALLRTGLTAGGNLALTAVAGRLGLDMVTGRAATAMTLAAGTDLSVAASDLAATGGTLGAAAGQDIAIGGSRLVAGLGGSLVAQRGVSVTGTVLAAQGGDLAINATTGDIGFDTSTVSASGALALGAAQGRVGQRQGSLAGATLTVQAGLGITVTDDGGAAPALTATAGALTLASAAGDIGLIGVVLDAAGDLGITASAGAVTIGRSAATAGGAMALSGATGLGLTDSVLLAGGTIAATAVTGDAALLRTRLTAGDGLVLRASAGRLGLDTVTSTSATGMTLASGGDTSIVASGLTATAGALGLTSSGVVTLGQSDFTAGRSASFAAAAGLQLADVAVQAGQGVSATTRQGDAVLLRSTLTASGDIGLAATGGRLSLDTVTASASGAMTLAAGGGMTIAASGLTALGGAFAATAGSAIGITGSGIVAGMGQSLVAQGGFAATGTTLTARAGDLGIAATGGDIALDGSTVTASGALALTASAGGIRQRRGSLSGASIAGQAASGIVVMADGGDAPRLTTTGGALGLSTGAGDVVLSGAVLLAATDLGLTAMTGAIGVTGGNLAAAGGALSARAGGAITIAGATASAGGGVTLEAGGDIGLANVAVTARAGALAATAGGGFGIAGSGLVAAGDLALSAGGTMQASGSTVAAGGAMALGAGAGLTVTATQLQASGAMTASVWAGDAALADAVVAANAVTLTAGGGILIQRGSIGAASVIALAAGGPLTAAGTSLSAGTGLAVTSRLATSLTDTVLTAGGTLAVTSTAGGLTQTRGSLTGGGDVSLRAAGDLLVTDAGSGTRPVLRSSGGVFSLRSDTGGITLRNAVGQGATGLGLAAGGAVSLTDTALTTPGRLAAAAGSGGLAVLRSSLASTAGDIDLTAGGAASIDSSAFRAARRVRVVSGGAMTLTSLTLNADTGDFEAGRPNPVAYGSTNGASTMTMNGVTASMGTALLFAAPGGITGLGPTVVTPRGTPLPAVLFDTRLAPSANPLTIVQPDVAGLPANQQQTQVRSAPGAQGPGAFGLPNQTTAAGPVALNLAAGQSAVFLLVDGGGISGTVTAGRLAVHGTGGGSTLFGSLNGSVGAEAARFADITRPIDANSLQKYRINSCVISSINCVVPPSVQIIPPRPTDQARFTIENNRINLADVLIPNIGEEDEDE